MFEKMDRAHQEIIYLGLKSLLETGRYAGYLFHNGDDGHPVYRAGADGTEPPYEADSPERNYAFKMLLELSETLRQSDVSQSVNWHDFSDWSSFCQFVVREYEHRREQASG